jgi:hypothetical protein
MLTMNEMCIYSPLCLLNYIHSSWPYNSVPKPSWIVVITPAQQILNPAEERRGFQILPRAYGGDSTFFVLLSLHPSQGSRKFFESRVDSLTRIFVLSSNWLENLSSSLSSELYSSRRYRNLSLKALVDRGDHSIAFKECASEESRFESSWGCCLALSAI